MVLENELAESLRSLQLFARELAQRVNNPVREPQQYLTNLRKAVITLGQIRPARSIYCPEEYVKQWKDFQEDQAKQLQRRAIRYLCWQPDVATSQPFQYFLDQNHVNLNARSLQGLVRSCHSHWSPEFAKSQVVIRVRDRLNKYGGTNALLSQWKEGSGVILGLKGAEEFGAEMIETLRPIKQHCEFWGIADETSAYVQVAVRYAAKVCRDQMDRVPGMRQYLLEELLAWNGWVQNVFKEEISQTVLHLATTQSEDVRESVRRFVLNDARLGDPRHSRNRLNWVGVSEAEQRVIEWLSKLDIVFFFESVLPKGEDPQGRKEFWLQYVPSIKKSRPLLRREDKERLQRDLREKGLKLIDAGSMDEWSTASAFLLDFGPLLVIEFSETGNACYMYRKNDVDKIIPDFWTSKPFVQRQLRRKDLVEKRIVHRQRKSSWHGPGWEHEAANTLAGPKFNIRPGDRR